MTDPDNGICETCGLVFDGYGLHHECECRICDEAGCFEKITMEDARDRDADLCDEHFEVRDDG